MDKTKKGRQKQNYFLKNFNNKLYCIKECCGRKTLKDCVIPLRKRGKKKKIIVITTPVAGVHRRIKRKEVKTAASCAGQVIWVNSDASAL